MLNGGGNIKQDSSYRLVSDINITTWNNKANSSHTHTWDSITGESKPAICKAKNAAGEYVITQIGDDCSAEGYLCVGEELYVNTHFCIYGKDSERPDSSDINIKIPAKSGTMALTDDLNIKGTWGTDGMMWFPGFNIAGYGYIFIIPMVNKATNISVSGIQIFNGQIWQNTTLLSSDKKANQFIGICENSNISDIEYGRVYLTRATITIS